jgi:hypothetical protein
VCESAFVATWLTLIWVSLGEELLDHMWILFLIFWEASILFPIIVILVYNPISSVWVFLFLCDKFWIHFLYRMRDKDWILVFYIWIYGFPNTICWRGCLLSEVYFWLLWQSALIFAWLSALCPNSHTFLLFCKNTSHCIYGLL